MCEELFALLKAGDAEALESIVNINMGLVRSVAARFFGRAENDDLVQVGCIGLLKAARGFDASRGTRFSTYAYRMIAGEMLHYIRAEGQLKVSRSIKELAAGINAQELEGVSLHEAAEKLGVTRDEAAFALASCMPCVSLDEPAGEGGARVGDLIPSGHSAEDEALGRAICAELLDALGSTEKTLLIYRYLEGLTQKETASLMDLSQTSVSRIEKKALIKLRSLADID